MAAHDREHPASPAEKDSMPADIEKSAPSSRPSTASSHHDNPDNSVNENEKPYSAFTLPQRRLILTLASLGAFFSPMTATYSLGTLNPLAAYYNVSPTLINLTLTTYLILQGLSPALFGSLSDSIGRRPAFIACLAVFLISNIALALQSSFAALLVLRCVQSAGISPCVALAFGVAADIATPAERGSAVAWMTAGAMLGPALGPVAGALLAQYLGWRAAFWGLAIVAGLSLILFAVAFPETARGIVGDGSIPPPKWNRTLLALLSKQPPPQPTTLARATSLEPRKRRWPNPLASLALLKEKDVALLLLTSATLYTCFYAVTTSVPALFAALYGFSDIEVGLAYLPYGFGVLIATLASGRLMDANFRRHARRLGIPLAKGRGMDLHNFPIERARFELVLPLILVGAAMTVVYGWLLAAKTSVAGPLVFLFLIGLFLTTAFQSASVAFVDLYPAAPATATAANNLCRCLMGAVGTALVNIIIERIGPGWTYTLGGAIAVLTSAALLALIRFGPAWREARRVKMERARERART